MNNTCRKNLCVRPGFGRLRAPAVLYWEHSFTKDEAFSLRPRPILAPETSPGIFYCYFGRRFV